MSLTISILLTPPLRLEPVHLKLGPNSYQAIQVVRALDKVNIIGADLVEVSPPFDQSGGTAFLGASIMFELLCVMVP